MKWPKRYAILLLTPACTTVLGMDRAELDHDAGVFSSGGTGSTTPPPPYYPNDDGCGDPNVDCPACLDRCNVARSACLNSPTCRQAVYIYRTCLNDACVDPDLLCSGKLSQKGPEAAQIAECVTGSCVQSCPGKALLSLCDLYCACMDRNCSGKLDNCLASCSALDANTTFCRWQHCEFASSSASAHCEHALGHNACLAGAARPSPCHGQPLGLPCRSNVDCCSTSCLNGNCVPL